MDVNYLPLTDMRIARTFCFTNLGQAMYLCSPTEVQRITYSQDTCENLQVRKHVSYSYNKKKMLEETIHICMITEKTSESIFRDCEFRCVSVPVCVQLNTECRDTNSQTICSSVMCWCVALSGDAGWTFYTSGDTRGTKQGVLQRSLWRRSTVTGQRGAMYAKPVQIQCGPQLMQTFLHTPLPVFLSFHPFHPVGELAAGKASRSLAQHIPGPGGIEGMKGAASGVVGDLARARIALDERGQKLGELEERTAAMMASADSFSKHAHEVKEKFNI